MTTNNVPVAKALILDHPTHIEVRCPACAAETIVLIAHIGFRIPSQLVEFCPRCGSEAIAVEEPRTDGTALRVSLGWHDPTLPKAAWQVIGECPLPIGLTIEWENVRTDRATACRLEAQAYRALAAAMEADPEFPCRFYLETFRPTGRNRYRAVIRVDEADEFELAQAARAALEAAGRTLDG